MAEWFSGFEISFKGTMSEKEMIPCIDKEYVKSFLRDEDIASFLHEGGA